MIMTKSLSLDFKHLIFVSVSYGLVKILVLEFNSSAVDEDSCSTCDLVDANVDIDN